MPDGVTEFVKEMRSMRNISEGNQARLNSIKNVQQEQHDRLALVENGMRRLENLEEQESKRLDVMEAAEEKEHVELLELTAKITRMRDEQRLHSEKLAFIEREAQLGHSVHSAFNTMLEDHAQKKLGPLAAHQQSIVPLLSELYADPKMTTSHRKLLECLLNSYELRTEKFLPLGFNQLCKKARVSTRFAKQRLKDLEDRKMIKRSKQGLRVLYKANEDWALSIRRA